MFGSLRLILALMVALSHAGVSIAGYHLGVPAVVIFFMLSGYVVAGLLSEIRPGFFSIVNFYSERMLRLLPLYYFFLIIGFAAWWLGVDSYFLHASPSFLQWIFNVLIIPLNYFMFYPFVDSFVLVPPAWSLGLEIQFYVLAPWLLKKGWVSVVLMLLSFFVYLVSVFGWINSDWFGYRLLCGNLFVFLIGAFLYRRINYAISGWYLILIWLCMFLLLLYSGGIGRWTAPFVFETLSGFVVGLPLVASLARLPRRSWDDALGQIAYGVFLAHFPVLWLFGYFGVLVHTDPHYWPKYVTLIVLASCAGHFLVERPLQSYRRSLRNR